MKSFFVKSLVTPGVLLMSGMLSLALITPARADNCTSSRVIYRTANTYTPTYVAPTYVAPTNYTYPSVVKKVVSHDYKATDSVYYKFVAVVPLVELPTYSAVYVPPYTPMQQAPSQQAMQQKNSDDLRQILEAIKGIDTRLKTLESRPTGAQSNAAQGNAVQGNAAGGNVAPAPATAQPAQPAQPEIPDVRKVNQLKCASCHERGNEANGGRFVLSEKDGSIVKLTNEQLAEVDDKIYAGAMPPQNAKAKAKGITPLTDLEYASFKQEIIRQRTANKAKGSR